MLNKMGYESVIFEKQDELPNNHSAVLRFRSSIVSDVTGIPFREVKVLRTVQRWRNEVADSLAYAMKATGVAALRSSVYTEAGMVKRYIAPLDFIGQLRITTDDPIYFNKQWEGPAANSGSPVISTMPMPVLAAILQYEWGKKDWQFRSVPGYNLNFDIPGIDVYGTVYIAEPEVIWNRISITGSRVTAEYSMVDANIANPILEAFANGEADDAVMRRFLPYLNDALIPLGMSHLLSKLTKENISVKRSQYQKIMPIPDAARKRFMLWASEKHNVYSLGRFATWRPGLLLDDLVNDVRQIEKMASGDHYHRRLKGV